MEIEIALIISFFAFLLTLFLTKFWIKMAKSANLTGRDVNKFRSHDVAESGGIAVILGFLFAVLLYVFFKTFYLKTDSTLIFTFALLTSVLLAGMLGFVDDILGWKTGLRKYQKLILTLPIAVPLVVINAGHSIMSIPFMGPVDLGLIYPLIIIPIGIIGATNGFNLLAGMNSLEAGMGAIILSTLGALVFSQGMLWLSFVCFLYVFSLLGFLVFNKYPAGVFPGDSLTYTTGALIAIVAILGNVEKVAVILFIPYFIELILKARSRFQAECFGVPSGDGLLKPRYEKNYSLTQAVMRYFPGLFKRNLKEYEVVLLLFLMELVFVVLSLFI